MHCTRPIFRHESLLKEASQAFKTDEQKEALNSKISTKDCLMSALSMFSLKYESLLQFDNHCTDKEIRHNIRTLYGIENIPSDTQMRERLDRCTLTSSRKAIKNILHQLQRAKVLDRWKFMNRYHIISLDGTEFFTSKTIHCKCCLTKNHKNKDVTYHHQMLIGSIVHPEIKQVFPIMFEPIMNEDGAFKNDCERNAAKRWVRHLRKDHPQLCALIVGDGLYSNDPFIATLEEHRYSYILVCKKDDHTYLWDWFLTADKANDVETLEVENNGTKRFYKFLKDVPLNDSSKRKVTVVSFKEINEKGKIYENSWVTDLDVTPLNVNDIVKAGRSRWKIENETFNTLKNQGYNFEHNYGHGNNNLSNVLAGLMLLAFLIDQCLEALNHEWQALLHKLKRRSYVFERIRASFFSYHINSWDSLYSSILDPPIFVI